MYSSQSPPLADDLPARDFQPARGELMPRVIAEGQELTVPSDPARGRLDPIVRNRGVLVLLLLTFGPLSLPLFWISPRFPLWSKLLITLGTIGVTIIFPIAITVYFAEYAMRPLLQAIQDANQTGQAW